MTCTPAPTRQLRQITGDRDHLTRHDIDPDEAGTFDVYHRNRDGDWDFAINLDVTSLDTACTILHITPNDLTATTTRHDPMYPHTWTLPPAAHTPVLDRGDYTDTGRCPACGSDDTEIGPDGTCYTCDALNTGDLVACAHCDWWIPCGDLDQPCPECGWLPTTPHDTTT